MNTFELRLNPIPFEQIQKGRKTIEMRLYDEKRQMFKIGDILIFKNRNDESNFIKTQILNLHLFSNFEDLYNNIDKQKLGYEPHETAKASDMEEYYSKEEQNKFGVVGIEIKVLN